MKAISVLREGTQTMLMKMVKIFSAILATHSDKYFTTGQPHSQTNSTQIKEICGSPKRHNLQQYSPYINNKSYITKYADMQNQLTLYQNMKNKKDLSINISLGALSNYNNKLVLTNRPTNTIEYSSKESRSGDNSKSKSKNGRQKQYVKGNFMEGAYFGEAKMMGYHLRSRNNKDHNDRENRDDNKALSRENSDSKHSRNDDLSVKSRQETKSYRKVQLPSSKTYRNEHKSTNVSILYESRPHQSQNLRQTDHKLPSETHRKLYTFCNEIRSNEPNKPTPSKCEPKSNIKDIEKESAQKEYSSTVNPTIMVRQEELKRFTHKFAREKIQFQQLINGYRQEIKQLNGINKGLMLENNDLNQCLHYKEQELQGMASQLSQMQNRTQSDYISHQRQQQQALSIIEHQKLQIFSLKQALTQHQNKIAQLQNQCQQKQRQLSKLQFSQQHQMSKLYLPLSNIHHVHSINTSLYSESPAKISQEILQELEWLRKECQDNQLGKKEMKGLLEFLRIQNEHVKRELQLEKQANQEMVEQLEEIKQKLTGQRQRNAQLIADIPKKIQNQSQSLKNLKLQIEQLENANATLQHNKQTLQRSLKVSSQMILCLKQQNFELKNQQVHQQKDPEQISTQQVKKIVMLMMKQQLELEDRFKKSQNEPIVLNQSLQRKYEQGYQSIRRKTKTKTQHCKTENYSNSPQSRKNYTETSFIEQFNNITPDNSRQSSH